jgi:hypothetical protein
VFPFLPFLALPGSSVNCLHFSALFFFQNLLKNLFSVGFVFFFPPPLPRGFCFLPSCWLLSNVVCTFFPQGVLAVTCSLSFSYLCISVFLRASSFVKCVFPFVCFFAFFLGGGRVFLVEGSFCVCVRSGPFCCHGFLE